MFAAMAAEHGIEIDDAPPKRMEETMVAKPAISELDEDEMIQSPVRGNARGQRGKLAKKSKTSVSQILSIDQGGGQSSPLFLANVEFLDDNGELVNQTRTNPKGRWLSVLAPGSYQVHVTKRFAPDSGKESIDTIYKIDVSPSDTPMELSPLSFDGG